MGEGIVITHQATETFQASGLTKWKNGMENNSTNSDFINAMMQEVEADKELFGENTEKVIELFKSLEQV